MVSGVTLHSQRHSILSLFKTFNVFSEVGTYRVHLDVVGVRFVGFPLCAFFDRGLLGDDRSPRGADPTWGRTACWGGSEECAESRAAWMENRCCNKRQFQRIFGFNKQRNNRVSSLPISQLQALDRNGPGRVRGRSGPVAPPPNITRGCLWERKKPKVETNDVPHVPPCVRFTRGIE